MARYSGYAASLRIDNGAGTYVAIAQVIDINGPGIKNRLIETTDRDSSGKALYVSGIVDNGKVKFKLNFDPDTTYHSMSVAHGLGTLAQSGALKSFRLFFPDTSPVTATFDAIVEEYTPDAPLNGALTADCTLQISGAITWA